MDRTQAKPAEMIKKEVKETLGASRPVVLGQVAPEPGDDGKCLFSSFHSVRVYTSLWHPLASR